MKRDMDLIREIAIELGGSQHELEASLFVNERHDYQDVARHMLMMEGAGLITTRKLPGDDCLAYCAAVDLTWQGNEFLAAAKDAKVWRKVMRKAAKTAGDVPFAVLVPMLQQALSTQFGM